MPNEPPPERKRWRWLRHEAIDLGDVAVQIVSVIVGILLALAINDWVQQRQQQATVNDAMRAIRAELTSNRAALHRNAAYWHSHAVQVLDASEKLKPPQSPRPCYEWPGWLGTHTEVADLTDGAYQTAIATQAIAHMPYKLAHRVAQIYSYQQQSQNVQLFILRHFIFSGEHSLNGCLGAIESFDRNEPFLSAKYTPLIGRDPAKWPTPPTIPRPPTHG